MNRRSPQQGADDEIRPEEQALCALLRSAAEAQITSAQMFLDTCGAAPMGLGEALEDIANEYLRLSNAVAEMRRLDLLSSNGNSGRQ